MRDGSLYVCLLGRVGFGFKSDSYFGDFGSVHFSAAACVYQSVFSYIVSFYLN